MFRFVLALVALIPFAFCQDLPALQWFQPLNNAGADAFTAMGADAQGNTYVAGSTISPNFPLKAAVQSTLGSAGLYRIDGPGSAYTRLGVNWLFYAIAADPGNPNVMYGVSPGGSSQKSVDAGITWAALTLPTKQVQQFAVDPSNGQNLYAVATDLGILKSTDGGATWNASNNGLALNRNTSVWRIWTDPASAALFAYFGTSLARSADGAASWQVVGPVDNGFTLYFDAPHPGVVYVFTIHYGVLKSTDDGQTFQSVSLPVTSLFADPNQPGRLLGNGSGNAGQIFESTDGGGTWTLRLSLTGRGIVAADWVNGFLYASAGLSGIVRISSDLQTTTPVGPPGAFAPGLAIVNGHVYALNSSGRNTFVVKLDPSGTVVYATYFGGSGNDTPNAMAVDPAGNVYVAGVTTSLDFPTTKGAYSTSPGNAFLFKLRPDGSVGYSTYFPSGSSTPEGLAVDGAGSAYLSGPTFGGLPTTPGAYKTVCGCTSFSTGFSAKPNLSVFYSDTFLTKFDPSGATLTYSTYLGIQNYALGSPVGTPLALGPDGSAFVVSNTVYHINAAGSSLLGSGGPAMNIAAMAIASDGSLYFAGSVTGGQFKPTAGAFQTTGPRPSLPSQGSTIAAIAKMDAQLQNTLAATYFGGPYGPGVSGLAIDAAGNVYIAGGTSPRGLPTRTPLFTAFGPSSGFLSQFSGDLSQLRFSTYLGDIESFGVQGIALGSAGNVIVAGTTGSKNVWVNSLQSAAPPSLRVDSILNAASVLDGPLSAGETILVRGAGFGSDAQLSIGGVAVPPLSITSSQITAVAPANLPLGPALVRVQSGGAQSNPVLAPVTAASPGIFSADGSGSGPGYILNQDGTLNTPSNPTKIGDRITIYATGVGPVSFTNGYAVTESPVNIFVDGFYANGVAALMGPETGFPGSVYRITVFVPDPALANPDLKNFVFPPLVGIVMQVAGANSQNGLSISIAP